MAVHEPALRGLIRAPAALRHAKFDHYNFVIAPFDKHQARSLALQEDVKRVVLLFQTEKSVTNFDVYSSPTDALLKVAVAMSLALLVACSEGQELSTADVRRAAEERVRAALDLKEDATLFTNVFVGEPVGGDTILCGTVEGTRSDGTPISKRRFIVATDPAKWMVFEPAGGATSPSQPDKFLEWHTSCLGEEEV